MCKPVPGSYNQSAFKWGKRWWGLGMAAAWVGPHAKNLHLAPDRWPHQHLVTQFLQVGCSSWRSAYSVIALMAIYYQDLIPYNLIPCSLYLCFWIALHCIALRCVVLLTAGNTHTHPFNGPFSGTTQVSRYQKGKTNLDFTEATDSEWQMASAGLYASLHLAADR